MGARARIATEDGLRRERGPSNFRQRDVTAAVKAIEAAGVTVRGVEFGPGNRFRVLVASGANDPGDDVDAAIAAFEAEHAG